MHQLSLRQLLQEQRLRQHDSLQFFQVNAFIWTMNPGGEIFRSPDEDFCLWKLLAQDISERDGSAISDDLRLRVVCLSESLTSGSVSRAIRFCREAAASMAIR